MYHADKKSYAPRRHTLEVPFYGEGDLLVDLEAGGSDHSRVGGYISCQRMRDSGMERSEQLVVMRKLNLSERRDSFKKQEAVQEVSFDEPDEKSSTTVPVASTTPQVQTQHQQHRTAWAHQTSEEVELEVPMVRRVTLVPQIAVQGSTESEQDEWEPCSDGEDVDEKTEQEVGVSFSEPQQAAHSVANCSHAAGATSADPQVGSSTPHKGT